MSMMIQAAIGYLDTMYHHGFRRVNDCMHKIETRNETNVKHKDYFTFHIAASYLFVAILVLRVMGPWIFTIPFREAATR